MLLRLTHPTSGVIRVDGRPVTDDESYRAGIGYMPQIARFPDNLTATELFALFDDAARTVAPATPRVDRAVRIWPSTSTSRCACCPAERARRSTPRWRCSFDPGVLVLDEPTAGLDPLSSATLKDEILARRDRGATVLVTSHIMSELEELCDDVAFLLDGARAVRRPRRRAHGADATGQPRARGRALMIREVA